MTKPSVLIAMFFVMPLMFGCSQEPQTPSPNVPAVENSLRAELESVLGQRAPATVEGKILQMKTAGRYVYLELQGKSGSIWAAIPDQQLQLGQVVAIKNPSPMGQFHSPTLNRTFELIYFGGGLVGQEQAATNHETSASNTVSQVVAVEGGLTVNQVYAQASELVGKVVRVRAKVVKYNAAIMGLNWIHLQDGSGNAANGTNDLTITTSETARVGEVVVALGTVVQNKDFGAGYSYSVLLENVSLTREE